MILLNLLISYTMYKLSSWYTQLTLTVSQPLPSLLENETYLCHFISGGVPFTVEAMGSGTTYTCNITGVIPSEFDGLLSTGE
jgi:hypothetical protein